MCPEEDLGVGVGWRVQAPVPGPSRGDREPGVGTGSWGQGGEQSCSERKGRVVSSF